MNQFLAYVSRFSEKLMPLLHVVLVLLMGMLVLRFIDTTLKRLAKIAPLNDAHSARMHHRTETLRHFVGSLGKAVLGALVVLVLINEMDLLETFAPVVAGAGIV